MTHVAFDAAAAREIIARHEHRPERLVQILVEFVRRFGHVPRPAVALVAPELNLSRTGTMSRPAQTSRSASPATR